ncbi:hypothetical protein OG762_17170 [Streptomyces sp. NBC_01136]|uniref:hypothetical protein n=1 Tax=Streptomyces sp. NBC_01136 TaxID=2903754 RepID=UPI00386FBC39|nr:hypothetical protein OG762_17170 [Streptomyces sp. NBC_01136]
MAQRWDADRQRWVDDDGAGGQDGGGAGEGGAPPDAEQQWWASAATQAGPLRPDLGPPETPVTPPPSPPPPPWTGPEPGPGLPGQVPGGGRGPGSADSRRLLVVIVAVAVLAGGVGGGVWALTRGDSSGHTDSGATRPAVTVTATQTAPTPDGGYTSGSPDTYADPAQSTDPAAQSTTPEPSPGYSRAVDPVGYTVDVPDGWVRKEVRGKLAPVVTYTAPGGNGRLMLFEVKESSLAESAAQAEEISRKLPGYQLIDRRSGSDWTEVTYRYDSPQNGATHVVDHRFQAVDGTLYAINASGPESEDMTGPLTTAVNSFCPTGADCASSA